MKLLNEINIFDRQLRFEVLQVERLREFILGGTIILISLGLLLSVFFLSDSYKEKVPELINAFEWIIILFLMLVLRSFIVRLVIRKRMDKGKDLPNVLRCVNSFLEITIPSLGIIILSLHIEPTAALVSPLLLLYFIFIILSSLELDPRLSFFTGLIASIEYLLITLFFITSKENQSNILIIDLPIAYIARAGILFVSGIVAGLVSQQIRKRILNTYSVIEKRDELEKVFGQQVSKEIVDEFIKNNMQIENKVRDACIMFLDIKDFSIYCEGRTPEEINNYQNLTLGFMIEIIKKHHGIVNQILGDGFMATFGAPIQKVDYCQDAVNASIEISNILKGKNESKEIPLTKIRIGLHSGPVVTGNVGTTERKQYSVTGNTVILAARLEQLNKELKTTILASKAVVYNSEMKFVEFKSLGEINVKGFTKQIEIYTIGKL